MQFVVVGAGNMGCVYGGNLARIGQQVAFIDVWKDHVDSIAQKGLRLEGLTGDFTVKAQAGRSAAEVPKADAVLICVNTTATAEAARTAAAAIKPDGYCLTLQNGVGNVEILEEALGKGRVLAGLSFQSGDLQGPGFVKHTNNGDTYLGELDRRKTPRLAHLCELLEAAGMHPVPVDDVMRTIWTKFIHNCGINALCAITGLRPGHIQDVPELDAFQTHIIEESLALVRAKGIEPTEADPVRAIKEYCSHKFHRPSMMQHLLRGLETEIDALNGYVARESRKLGLAAPCSDALTSLIKGRQHRPKHPEGPV
jgi:2-dehydropantoate 2-reductase